MTLGERDLPAASEGAPAFAALHGLRSAADSLDASVHDLAESPPTASVDVQRLCLASFSAGRLVGYLEALAATDAMLARQACSELGDVMASVDAVRARFSTGV